MADIQHYSHDAGWKHTILRGLLYLVLILFAAYYLFPDFIERLQRGRNHHEKREQIVGCKQDQNEI